MEKLIIESLLTKYTNENNGEISYLIRKELLFLSIVEIICALYL